MMKLRIVSDGTPEGTQVLNAQTGEELDMVESVSWSVSTKQDVAKAQVTLILAAADIVGESEALTRAEPDPATA